MRDEAMARAEKAACTPGGRRCYAFPDSAAKARKSCTAAGWCKVGWVVRDAGRESRDGWIDLATGEGHVGKRTNTRT